MCVCLCVCVHVCACVHVGVCIHAVHVCACVCMYVCVPVSACTCACACLCLHAYACVSVRACVCGRTEVSVGSEVWGVHLCWLRQVGYRGGGAAGAGLWVVLGLQAFGGGVPSCPQYQQFD